MAFVIGTAGHIDHGKTSLVKALTGQDTDRLKEEKERGISIDLGFAFLDLDEGSRVGVVDVPGHERFIRNMLAGVHGIDVVLFTVAADDGVMPQTEEHLDVLHLLNVRRAIFVVTKIDLVAEPRVRDVEGEIRALIAGTTLDGSPIARFSFPTQEGLADIRLLLSDVLTRTAQPAPSGFFRLPIDRAFVIPGHGLVVTGTATSGRISAGEQVLCLPASGLLRVRSAQVHGRPVNEAVAGQRVALNLTGQQTPPSRGDVIASPQIALVSSRFDARIETTRGAKHGIKDRQRVRVHVGTAERLGAILLVGRERVIASGESAWAQIALDNPVHVLRGDRFIVRDETARRTIGGGTIVLPAATPYRRSDAGRAEALRRFQSGDLPAVVEAFTERDREFAVPLARLCEFFNETEVDLDRRLAGETAIRRIQVDGDRLFTLERRWRALVENLVTVVSRFHSENPLAVGIEREALREQAGIRLSPRLFRIVIDAMVRDRLLAADAGAIRLAGHAVRLNDEAENLARKIKTLLGANALAPPEVADLGRSLGLERGKLTELLRALERERAVVRVSTELYFLPTAIDRAKRALTEDWPGKTDITPSAFRDAVGTTRKYAIPLLEYFDRQGITERIGTTRRVKG